MTAVALLAELRERGATVAVVGDRLRIEAPRGVLTPELRTRLAAAKPELLALVEPHLYRPGCPCVNCGPVDAALAAFPGARIVPPASTAARDDGGPCQHVADDPELADWYRRNPHLTCARCWLDGTPLRGRLR